MNVSKQVGRRFLRAVDGFRRPAWSPSGHYYSPIPSEDDIERAVSSLAESRNELVGIRYSLEQQASLLKDIASSCREFVEILDLGSGSRYSPANEMFNLADALVLYGMLQRSEPKRLIEVGSGYSSAVVLDWMTNHSKHSIDVKFVEPYTKRLRSLLEARDSDRCIILERPVQDAPLEIFTSLEAGDVLLIDSTHVAKAGSDVNFLFFEVFPRLSPGVVVHVHDIFWPFEYPARWLQEGRAWNESYLLRSWLIDNSRASVLFFSSMMWNLRPELIQELLPSAADDRPGSIWIQIE